MAHAGVRFALPIFYAEPAAPEERAGDAADSAAAGERKRKRRSGWDTSVCCMRACMRARSSVCFLRVCGIHHSRFMRFIPDNTGWLQAPATPAPPAPIATAPVNNQISGGGLTPIQVCIIRVRDPENLMSATEALTPTCVFPCVFYSKRPSGLHK